jgi:hypothetical protein
VIVSPDIDGNAFEPVRKWLIRLPTFKIPESTNKRFLDQIFEIGTLTGESKQEGADHALMAQDKHIEGLKIAGFCQVDFFEVFTLLDLFHRVEYVHNLGKRNLLARRARRVFGFPAHLDDGLGSIFSPLTNREIPPQPVNQFVATVTVLVWLVPSGLVRVMMCVVKPLL